MKKGINIFPCAFNVSLSTEMEGKSIEQVLREALANKEPIKTNTDNLSYTERKDGVLPIYDIRTDRFEIARQAADKVNKTNAAKRHMQDHPEAYQHDENGNMILDEAGMGKPIYTGGEA